MKDLKRLLIEPSMSPRDWRRVRAGYPKLGCGHLADWPYDPERDVYVNPRGDAGQAFITWRRARIMAMRNENLLKFSEIAAHFRISMERARQIYCVAERIERTREIFAARAVDEN
jgi:hypothetical protein